jgi:hypothetical protein
MTILLIIALIIAVYIISDKISNYTLLSNYTWFDNLSIKLYDYEGKFKSLLQKIYYLKLFTCRSCNVFWIALITLSSLHFFSEAKPSCIINLTPELVVTTSLIIFLIHKVENQDV